MTVQTINAERRTEPVQLTQWDRIASKYDWSPFEHQYVMKPFLNELGNLRNRRVLEFGCGIGVVTKEMAISASEIIALDSSESMLSFARVLCAGYPHITFREQSFHRKLPYTAMCDLTVMAFALEQQRTIEDMAMSLRNACVATDWEKATAAIVVLIPHPCFDFNQTGDIRRQMAGSYVERTDIKIDLTPAHGQAVTFYQPHWCLEDYFTAANAAGLGIYDLKEIGNNGSEDVAFEPRYMTFKCRPRQCHDIVFLSLPLDIVS